MNDLAEKALLGLDAAVRAVARRPMTALGASGFVLASAVVVSGGRLGAVGATRALTGWLDLTDTRAVAGGAVIASIMVAALVALIVLWLVALEVVRRTRQGRRRVWWLVGAWATPFAVGPPLLDNGVYRQAAYGLLQRTGRDPYTSSPDALGGNQLVTTIDPGARGLPSSAGPLGSLLQHLCASVAGGTPLGTVIVLRVVGVLAAVAIGRLVASLAGRGGGHALMLATANPLVLLFAVSSPHLEAVTAVCCLAALRAASRRRWSRAAAWAAVAGSIGAQAFVLVPVLIVRHAIGRRDAVRLVVRDVAVAAAVVLGTAVVQPDAFGWIRAVSQQFADHTPFSIAGGIGALLTPVVDGAAYDDLAASGRLTAVIAAVSVLAYLIATPLRRTLVSTAAYALLTVGLLGPTLRPWYLLPGVAVLAVAAVVPGRRRTWLVGLSAAACLLAPAGFSRLVGDLVTAGGLALVAAALGTVFWLEHSRAQRAARELSAAG